MTCCGVGLANWYVETGHVAAQDVYQPRGEFKNTKVAMTIHNIAFQVTTAAVLLKCMFCVRTDLPACGDSKAIANVQIRICLGQGHGRPF